MSCVKQLRLNILEIQFKNHTFCGCLYLPQPHLCICPLLPGPLPLGIDVLYCLCILHTYVRAFIRSLRKISHVEKSHLDSILKTVLGTKSHYDKFSCYFCLKDRSEPVGFIFSCMFRCYIYFKHHFSEICVILSLSRA